MGPESRIVKKILDGVREKFPGSYLRKIHGGPYQHAGIPDIIGCINGYFVGFEVKTTSGRVSGIQKLEGEEIIKSKGIYAVVTNLSEVLEALEGLNSFTGQRGT